MLPDEEPSSRTNRATQPYTPARDSEPGPAPGAGFEPTPSQKMATRSMEASPPLAWSHLELRLPCCTLVLRLTLRMQQFLLHGVLKRLSTPPCQNRRGGISGVAIHAVGRQVTNTDLIGTDEVTCARLTKTSDAGSQPSKSIRESNQHTGLVFLAS